MVICARRTFLQTRALVEFGGEGSARLAVVREGSGAGAAGGVAVHADALIQILKVAFRADGLAFAV